MTPAISHNYPTPRRRRIIVTITLLFSSTCSGFFCDTHTRARAKTHTFLPTRARQALFSFSRHFLPFLPPF